MASGRVVPTATLARVPISEPASRAMLAATPEPPYVAVIFTTERSGEDEATFQATDERLWEMVAEQPGYLGGESTSDG